MKKSKFTEQQIVFALHQAGAGVKVSEVFTLNHKLSEKNQLLLVIYVVVQF